MEPSTPSNFPPTAQAPRSNWWSRNWKWFVPTGCLTLAVLFVVFIASIMLFAFAAMKSTEVYQTALSRAKSNAAVIEALGTPIKEGLFFTGNTSVNGASGNADMAIPISGPKGKGTIYAVATKSAGRWSYTTLEVEIKATGNRIPLEAEVLETE